MCKLEKKYIDLGSIIVREWRNLSFNEQLDKKDFTKDKFGSFQPNLVKKYLYLLEKKHFLKEAFLELN